LGQEELDVPCAVAERGEGEPALSPEKDDAAGHCLAILCLLPRSEPAVVFVKRLRVHILVEAQREGLDSLLSEPG
jgi:hypothetical protein